MNTNHSSSFSRFLAGAALIAGCQTPSVGGQETKDENVAIDPLDPKNLCNECRGKLGTVGEEIGAILNNIGTTVGSKNLQKAGTIECMKVTLGKMASRDGASEKDMGAAVDCLTQPPKADLPQSSTPTESSALNCEGEAPAIIGQLEEHCVEKLPALKRDRKMLRTIRDVLTRYFDGIAAAKEKERRDFLEKVRKAVSK